MNHLALLLALTLSACSCAPRDVTLNCPTSEPDFFEQEFENVRAVANMICDGCAEYVVAVERRGNLGAIALGLELVVYSKYQMALKARKHGWGVPFAIFAHEMGHLLDRKADKPTTELSADRWAGCITAIAQRDPDAADLFESFEEDFAHPDGSLRKAAYLKGYKKCYD